MSNLTEVYGEEIKMLIEKGKTNREISSLLGISKSTVQSIASKNGYIKNKWTLSNLQEEVLIANIIGDGCLFKSTENSNARMNLAHSLKQEIYFNFKYDILKDLIRCTPKKRSWVDKRTGNEYHEIRFQSKVHPKFTELWLEFYENGKKIIPKNSLDKFGDLLFAIKYFDDGCKTGGSYTIAMCDYDEKSIENFMLWMLEKLNIKSNLHKNKIIYFPTSEKPKLYKIFKKYATEDLWYKI